MMELTLIQKITVSAIPIIFAITVHEASHGYAAKHFGDLTAEKMGRITLNPIKHIDLIGTILLPALTLMLGGILFGWAKPVPVNFANLNNPKKDMLWVAAAGPASNFIMAIFWVLVLKYSASAPEVAAFFLLEISINGIKFIAIATIRRRPHCSQFVADGFSHEIFSDRTLWLHYFNRLIVYRHTR